MATHFHILAWRIPWTEEPGGLQSMGSQKCRTQLSNLTASLICGIFKNVTNELIYKSEIEL